MILVEVEAHSAAILGSKEVWISLYDSASSETLLAGALSIIDAKCKKHRALRKFFSNCSIGHKKKRPQVLEEEKDS